MKISNKKSAIGLVLDSAELRAVEVCFTPSPHAVACGSITLPQGLVKDGIITDRTAAGALLSEMLQERGFTDAPFVLGAKNENMLLRSASMPRVPDDKMRTAVMLQAQQFIPVPVRELVLDYVFCGESEQDGRQMAEILLVGAKKPYIDNLIGLVGTIGRKVDGVDSALLAMVRLKQAGEEISLRVEVDHDAVSIAFVQNEQILLTRSVSHDASLRDEQLDKDALEQLASAVAEDIRTSVLYFGNLHPGKTPHRVLITGPIPDLEALAQQVGKRLSMEITVPATYPQVDGISPDNLYKYATCISLALSAGETQAYNRVSLLSEDYRNAQKQAEKLSVIRKKLTIALLVLLVIAVGAFGAKMGGNAKIAALRSERTKLENQCGQMAEFQQLYQQKNTLETKLSLAMQTDSQWISAFHTVTNRLPAGIWIDSATTSVNEAGELILQMQCGAVNYQAAADTLTAMKNCAAVLNTVCSTTSETPEQVAFDLTLTIAAANAR